MRHAADLTRDAIAEGVDVIFQATFFDESGPLSWRGHADFLERVPDVKSDSGSFVYEPVDTKLAHSVKPGAVLQLCQYASQLTEIQHYEPRLLHIELGDGGRSSFRYASVAAYFRLARLRFEAAILAGPGETIYPEPVAHCKVCAWASRCDQRRRDDDHLSFIPLLGRDHVRKFVAAGIPTVAELARTTVTSVPHIGAQVVERFQRQARLQVAAREAPAGPPPFELIEPSGPAAGSKACPVPSAGDLYLDLEGDPFVGTGGLEYLFGIGWVDEFGRVPIQGVLGSRRRRRTSGVRGRDRLHRRTARAPTPSLHVYHYAAYERTAFGRLMGKYGTREDEVDDLLRGRVLVDLFKVVRQGVRVGVESYSIKKLEPLYMAASRRRHHRRRIEHRRVRTLARDARPADPLRHREVQPRRLRVDVAPAPLARGASAPKPSSSSSARSNGRSSPDPSDALDEAVDAPSDLHARLAADLPGPPDRSSAPTDHARWVLAHLLEWHRREVKPVWWRYFDIVTAYAPGDLVDDRGCLDLLEYVGVDGEEKNSLLHRYRYDPEQEHKIKVGARPSDPAVSATSCSSVSMACLPARSSRSIRSQARSFSSGPRTPQPGIRSR